MRLKNRGCALWPMFSVMPALGTLHSPHLRPSIQVSDAFTVALELLPQIFGLGLSLQESLSRAHAVSSGPGSIARATGSECWPLRLLEAKSNQ